MPKESRYEWIEVGGLFYKDGGLYVKEHFKAMLLNDDGVPIMSKEFIPYTSVYDLEVKYL